MIINYIVTRSYRGAMTTPIPLQRAADLSNCLFMMVVMVVVEGGSLVEVEV